MGKIEIRLDPHGGEVIWSEKGGRAVPLAAADIYIRASDGNVFIGDAAILSKRGGLQRLQPHEPEMVAFWMKQRGAGTAKIFAGEPPGG